MATANTNINYKTNVLTEIGLMWKSYMVAEARMGFEPKTIFLATSWFVSCSESSTKISTKTRILSIKVASARLKFNYLNKTV